MAFGCRMWVPFERVGMGAREVSGVPSLNGLMSDERLITRITGWGRAGHSVACQSLESPSAHQGISKASIASRLQAAAKELLCHD